jgi:small subunit ribosomal protein S6
VSSQTRGYCLYSLSCVIISSLILKETRISQDDKKLHDYELVVIISPEVLEEAVDGVVDRISQFITDSGGSVSNVEKWGKKKLAYPIKSFTEGNYVLARFKMKPDAGKELEASLQLSEEVFRHLLVRLNS